MFVVEFYFVDFESCSGVKLGRLWVTCAVWRNIYALVEALDGDSV